MSRKVLVIDDCESFVSLLGEMLEYEGLDVDRITGDYSKMWDHVWDDLPDVILLDVQLEGEDGRVLCSRLKEDRHTRRIPVILMTALTGLTTRDLIEYGADGIIYKPFEVAQLLNIMDSTCRLYSSFN